jgi:uncharacterized membrane protein
MNADIERLERALAAAEKMTDAEYLALHEEAKKYAGPDLLVSECELEPETILSMRMSPATLAIWSTEKIQINVVGYLDAAAYNADAELPLVA